MNQPAPAETPPKVDPDDDLTHIVCCQVDPPKALCGRVLDPTDEVPIGAHPNPCIVCHTMAINPCPVCGVR